MPKKIIKAWMLVQKINGRWIPWPTDNPFIARKRGKRYLEDKQVKPFPNNRKLVKIEIKRI